MGLTQFLQVVLLSWAVARAWRVCRWAHAHHAVSSRAEAVLRAAKGAPGALAATLETHVRSSGVAAATGLGLDAGGLDSAGAREAEWARIYMLRGLGRLIPATTLLAMVIELSWGLAGGTGLMALQAGLPQRVAFGHALASLAVGIVSAAVHAWLVRRAHAGLRAAERAQRSLEAAATLAS